MKITKTQLGKLLKEMTDMHALGVPSGGIDPLEYKLVSVISRAWEESVKGESYEGTYESWPQEIDNAAADLEDMLLGDPSVLGPLLSAIQQIEERLHGGGYS